MRRGPEYIPARTRRFYHKELGTPMDPPTITARVFNVVWRGPRRYLRLNRETIAIARYVAAARRLPASRWRRQRPPLYSILSDEIESILAKRENREPKSATCRRWKANRLRDLMRWFSQYHHPLITTSWCCLELLRWNGAKGTTGIDPYSLKPWASISESPSRTPWVPLDSDL